MIAKIELSLPMPEGDKHYKLFTGCKIRFVVAFI